MNIGEVIRRYRKQKNMTQEEMAVRLGVTAPAVNKWENGNSYPDILLLAPIARLLEISLDTLLAFREELTAEEIREIVYEADAKLKAEPYDQALLWAKRKLEQYPGCHMLIWQLAVIFDIQRAVREVPDPEQYDDYLCSLYHRVMESSDETMRHRAADSLFGFCMRKKQYDRAEEYLNHFSPQDPERKRKQAWLFCETGRKAEACRAYEELLFSCYGVSSLALYGMYLLAMEEQDRPRARLIVEKQEELARCFDMGRYYETWGRLELAAEEGDGETVIGIARELLSGPLPAEGFSSSPLYEHMEFREPRKEFQKDQKARLIRCFSDWEKLGFLKDAPFKESWEEVLKSWEET